MTREDRIASGVQHLNAGEFQCLVSAYLYRKLGYADVIEVGMKPGTRKTRSGTPDSFYRTGSRCALMEAGSYERPSEALQKIREDIGKCITYRDDHPELDVERIVIAYACPNIDPAELTKLAREYEREGVELNDT